MFKKACKSHTDPPLISKGVAVMKPGAVYASVVKLTASDGDTKCRREIKN
jgi:hypothetical protein